MKLRADLAVESISITGLDSELFPTTVLKGHIKILAPAAGKLKTSFTISYGASQPEFDLLKKMWEKRALEIMEVENEEDT